MPVFKPFRGITPYGEYIKSFPTRPLSNYTHEEIVKKAEREFSYVRMVEPYLSGEPQNLEQNLGRVRANYEELLRNHNLHQEEESGYYLYCQILPDGSVFRGLLGLVSVEDYNSGKIKKHEETLTHRKEKLSKYLEGVNLQAEPVLLTYSSNAELEALMSEEERKNPVLEYADSKGTKHRVWKIQDEETLKKYEQILAKVEAFYIADGHHRMGSTALYSERRKDKNPNHTGNEPYNFVYSFIVSDQSIKINDFNKVVKDLNGLTVEQFLHQLEDKFIIENKGENPYYPEQKHFISLYLDGQFYKLTLKEECCCEECLGIIDHYLLDKYILSPILGIDDLKTTKRVDYLRGSSCVEGITKLKEKVDKEGYKVAFGVHPVSFSDLVEIADKNLKMPPKCTYIEPKLVTALVMYDMK